MLSLSGPNTRVIPADGAGKTTALTVRRTLASTGTTYHLVQ